MYCKFYYRVLLLIATFVFSSQSGWSFDIKSQEILDEQEIKSDPVHVAEGDCSKNAAGPAVLVRVENIKDVEGNLRAQVYGPNPDDFLEKGKKLVRVDVPVTSEGEQEVCVPFPSVGQFALVVMHDRNANGKADFFSEGFGFSNNPKLKLAAPDGEDVMFTVVEGISKMTVELKYIFGSDEKQEKRRKLKRR
ncbi:DUF2141 domain-containing protein [Kordiimonas pumila]|uniref:DUF2141 domain-containing protein n=1 Tax=Kordiimonas pumila TaxID=2161677 RepID=A0ABV7D3S0_9PROT|nr:DUF2141 domain-containing protein [Kordiimonas pumila]